jgi:NADH:ubiquinone oxidoreductase subunit C
MRIVGILNFIFFNKFILINLKKQNICFFFFKFKFIKNVFFFFKYSMFIKKIFFLLTIFVYENIKIINKSIVNFFSIFWIFFNNYEIYFITTTVKNKLISFEKLFLNLKWQEREVKEFFGINFYNKSDLRSLYLWNNFLGFPLKKDFPTIGFFELINKYRFGLHFNKIHYI